jgi:hypothetical protein
LTGPFIAFPGPGDSKQKSSAGAAEPKVSKIMLLRPPYLGFQEHNAQAVVSRKQLLCLIYTILFGNCQ